MRRASVPVRLVVDPVRCDGFGHSAELAPGLVRLDEWGYPIVSEQAIAPPFLEEALLAVRMCPRRALMLRPVSTRGPRVTQ